MNEPDFDINHSLKEYLSDPASVSTPEADEALVDCERDPDSLSAELVLRVLNPIVDDVADNPEAIGRRATFDSLQFLLKCAPTSPPSQPTRATEPASELFVRSRSRSLVAASVLSTILDLVVSGLSCAADSIASDFEADHGPGHGHEGAAAGAEHHKPLLERYGFLLQWAIAAVESKTAETTAAAGAASGHARPRGAGARSAKAKANAKDKAWDPAPQLQTALDVMCKVLRLKLARIFVATSERETFVNLFTRPIYHMFEHEARVKSATLRMHAFRVLCIAVKHHGHAFGAQTSIVQSLSYFEHLSEPMADFLKILAEQYDYPQLTDDILRELSNKEFNSNDSKGPKSVAAFITKLSELVPRLVIKQMTGLVKQLDSESYTMRCAIIEVCGNLIAEVSKQGDERGPGPGSGPDPSESPTHAFFDLLQDRFLDVNPYCRCRALQVFAKLCDLDAKFPARRLAVATHATRSLEDKSSHVRRHAIRLLNKLVVTHPYSGLHGGQLALTAWRARLAAIDAELDALQAPAGAPGLPPPDAGPAPAPEDTTVGDDGLYDDATRLDGDSAGAGRDPSTTPAAAADDDAATGAGPDVMRLQLTRKYYQDAIHFISGLHAASATVRQLLSSRNKSEVIEAMDFFVRLDAFRVETAATGTRRMLRLIWTKANSDEGKGVQMHLIDCFKALYFETPPPDQHHAAAAAAAATYIAHNLTSLTFDCSPADLTSLEQLLSLMMKAGELSETVLARLWRVYAVDRDISRKQRRGAIAVLGMLALAEPAVVVKEMETLLRVGLGRRGRADLRLAKYSCIALKRMNPTGRQLKDAASSSSSSSPSVFKLPNDHPVLLGLAALTEMDAESQDWYGAAEQAIAAIYALSNHPDVLCTTIIRRKTKRVFEPPAPAPLDRSVVGQGELLTPPPEGADEARQDAGPLSQLLFIVGHVAIKQIVHLELCELEFKRRKAEKEKAQQTNSGAAATTATATATGQAAADDEQDELDLIGGTTEDDFSEAMAHIRERELLYGHDSLLANFGPLVTEICGNNTACRDGGLQAAATLCMAKLMCVSAEFCEKNLPLLITILERSDDPIIRSNVVIALGDMAVCFNHLIDENTDFLYRRLSDGDSSVKRTCLMTLTFLILAGQVKVKGQLGEMAKCLEDADKRIADLSKMFFAELATKDNAVYNHFVDMFSILSAEPSLEEDALRRIVKFLASFIEKDKHAKQLADKLAARLARCETERQWNDVAYALSQLPHKNEEIQKMVGAGFRVVQASA
ncbi:MAG: Condensin complex subunit [Phylliscum demangeonii]|nr:MAG: Condensin complex subunit [Phylliscum demangeonii]